MLWDYGAVMKILVLGAGAIGSVFGGFLAKGGNSVCLVGRRSHLDEIKQQGLLIEGIWGTHRVHTLIGYERLSDLETSASLTFDVILLSVKSYDTESILKELLIHYPDPCPVVSLQNGLGNIEKIEKLVGKKKTIGGRVIFGVEFVEPGRVRVTVSADKTVIGGLPGGIRKGFVKNLAGKFTAANIPTGVTDDIQRYIWGKVIYNCALNGLATLMNVHYGALLSSESSKYILTKIIEEMFAIIKQRNIVLDWQKAEEYQKILFDSLIPLTFKHHPSMLQDIIRHKRTEIDALNGAIVEMGRETGTGVPFNWAITQFIKAKESLQE
jgi:2-dehydropantoate 2-reductase